MKMVKRLLLMSLLMLCAMPVLAQDASAVSLPGGYSITLPEGWEAALDAEFGGFTLTDGDVDGYVLAPDALVDLVEIEDDDDARDVLISLSRVWFDSGARRREVELDDLFDRETAVWDYEQQNFEGTLYVITFGEGEFGALDFSASNRRELRGVDDAIDEMLASFTGEGGTPVVGGGGEGGGGDPCFVSVETEQTARLRVGPGENRTPVAFLPAGDEFEVNGRLETDDGEVWYRLNREEAAPRSSAAEIWVAADDVEESGDCDLVADASAPPVVPIVGGGGSTGGSTGGGATGGTTGGAGSPAPEGAVLPQSGRWTLTLDPTTFASCVGTQTISFPTTDLFFARTFTENVSAAADGSTITVSGNVYQRTGANQYTGVLLLGGQDSVQLILSVASSTRMTGSLIFTFYEGSLACSSTTPVVMTRR